MKTFQAETEDLKMSACGRVTAVTLLGHASSAGLRVQVSTPESFESCVCDTVRHVHVTLRLCVCVSIM